MEFLTLSHKDIINYFPKRNSDTHKGDYGRIFMLCGSRRFTGAPYLAAMGALRSGAGLVYSAVPESIYEITASRLVEPIVIPMPDSQGKFSYNGWNEIAKMLSNMDVVLIGCGMGVSADTSALTKMVLENYNGTVILDADGINVIYEHKDSLRGRNGQTILTPHFGEFCRFAGEVPESSCDAAMKLAKKYQAVILLKGNRTLITDGEVCYRNETGNPGMAVGGSGDLLSGIIASLVGQKMSPLEAAAVGAWLHGKAGDICAEEIGEYGMLPSDMLNVLPRLLK